MNLAQMVAAPLRQLLVFRGRTSRHAFWSWLLLVWLAFAISAVVLRALAPDLLIALVLPAVLLEYLLLWAIAVRRLHDTGRSGWSLLITLIPALGPLVLIVWLASPRHAGDNAYGPPPS